MTFLIISPFSGLVYIMYLSLLQSNSVQDELTNLESILYIAFLSFSNGRKRETPSLHCNNDLIINPEEPLFAEMMTLSLGN